MLELCLKCYISVKVVTHRCISVRVVSHCCIGGRVLSHCYLRVKVVSCCYISVKSCIPLLYKQVIGFVIADRCSIE